MGLQDFNQQWRQKTKKAEGGVPQFQIVSVRARDGSSGFGFRFRLFLLWKGLSCFCSLKEDMTVPVPLSIPGRTVPTFPVFLEKSGRFRGVPEACARLHANFGEAWRTSANFGEPTTVFRTFRMTVKIKFDFPDPRVFFLHRLEVAY